MAPRRILFITRSLSPSRGGMQTYASALLAELADRSDIDVAVASFRAPRALLPLFLLHVSVRALFFPGGTIHLGDAALAPIAFIVRLFRPSARLTLTTYGLDVSFGFSPYQALLRPALRLFDRIVAISEATKKELLVRGVRPERIVVIPCGISLPGPSSDIPRSDTPVLLLLGRQIKRKGTAWFLRNVFSDVLRMHPSALLIIAGDGPELPRIRAIVSERKWGHCVRVLGGVNEEMKDRLYREATLFLMPNIFVPGDMEGFGLVCVEAAARGLPAVAAKMQGIQDAVIEGVTGTFFFPEDAKDALRAIDAALAESWDPAAMGAACAERFSASVMASRYVRDVF